MKRRSIGGAQGLVVSFGVAAACAPHVEPTPEQQQAAAEAVAATKTEAVVEAKVEVVPQVPEKPATSARPDAVDVELALHVVARGDAWLDLYELVGGQMIVQLSEEIVLASADGPLLRDPSLRRGLEIPEGDDEDGTGPGELSAIVGRWPDAAFVSVTADAGRGMDNVYDLYRWQDGWTTVDNAEGQFAWDYDAVAPWHAGSLLALRYYEQFSGLDDGMYDEEGSEEDEEDGPEPPPVVQFDILGESAQPAPRFGKDGVDRFDAIESGAVLGVRSGVALHWKTGRTRATERKLPRVLPFYVTTNGVRLVDGGKGWIYGEANHPGRIEVPYIAEFDGKAWKELDVPCCGSVVDVRLGADGSLVWVTSLTDADRHNEQTLWRRRLDGATERTRVVVAGLTPERVAVKSVIWRGPEDVWALAKDGNDVVVLHSRARADVLELRSAAPLDTFAAFDADDPCAIVYLPIEAGVDAADDLRKQLAVLDGMLEGARVELVEARYLGKNGAGLMVRTADGMAGALASIDTLAGGLGDPVCGEPEIERVIAGIVPRGPGRQVAPIKTAPPDAKTPAPDAKTPAPDKPG